MWLITSSIVYSVPQPTEEHMYILHFLHSFGLHSIPSSSAIHCLSVCLSVCPSPFYYLRRAGRAETSTKPTISSSSLSFVPCCPKNVCEVASRNLNTLCSKQQSTLCCRRVKRRRMHDFNGSVRHATWSRQGRKNPTTATSHQKNMRHEVSGSVRLSVSLPACPMVCAVLPPPS